VEPRSANLIAKGLMPMGNDQTLARGGAGLSDTDVLTVMIAFGSLMLLLVDVMIKLIELHDNHKNDRQ
ncbi:MAG: putative holin-like toxin, partial [Schleiferilactobacillus harbinensis]